MSQDQHSSRWKGYPDPPRRKTVIAIEKQEEKRRLFKKLLSEHNASTLAYVLGCTEVNIWKIETGMRILDDRQYTKLKRFYDSLTS